MIIALVALTTLFFWILIPVSIPTVWMINEVVQKDEYCWEIFYIYPENANKALPFSFQPDPYSGENEPLTRFSCKLIYSDIHNQYVHYYVETDTFPLAWLFWWVAFRIEKTRSIIDSLIVVLLTIWGLVEIKHSGNHPTLKSIIFSPK